MKKIFVLIAIILCVSLSACSSEGDTSAPMPKQASADDYKKDKIELVYNQSVVSMHIGDEASLDLTIESENGYAYVVEEISSEDESIITYNDGIVKAVGIGNGRLKITISNKTPRTINVAVSGNTKVSIFKTEELYDTFKNAGGWSAWDGSLFDARMFQSEDTKYAFEKRVYWGDKGDDQFTHTDSMYFMKMKTIYPDAGMPLKNADGALEINRLSSDSQFDIWSYIDGHKIVTIRIKNDSANFEFDENGFLISSQHPEWLLENDAVAFRELCDWTTDFVSFSGMTVNDFIDIEQFISAVSEG